MSGTIVLCTDGSELAGHALRAGLAVVAPADRYVVVMAVQGPDPAYLFGASGMAGPTMTQEEFDAEVTSAHGEGTTIVGETIAALGLRGDERRVVEGRVVEGPAGPAICVLAEQLDAAALVIGSRGRGGLKRALLGSVSDHVVRHAPCPVVVANTDS